MSDRLLIFIRLMPPRTGLTVVNDSILKFLDAYDLKYTLINVNKSRLTSIKMLIFNRFDTVYLNLSSSKKGSIWDLMVLTILTIKGSKIVSHIHNGDYLCNGMNRVHRCNLSLCSKVIVLSNIQRSHFLSKGIPSSKLEVIYNQKRWKQELYSSQDNDEKTVVYLSNFIESKGYKKVVESFLRTPWIKANLRLAGAFFNEEEETFFTTQIEGNPRITYVGTLETDAKVRDFLLNADVFVLPTEYDKESLPMSIIEALLCGNVVVASKKGSIPELLDENCILLEDTSIDSVYNGITEALGRVNQPTKKLIIENITCKLKGNDYDKLHEILG